MTEEETLACATLAVSNMLLLYLRRKKKLNKRRFWMNETLRQRDTPGYCSPLTQSLRSNDSEYYKQFMRMDRDMFDKLLGILEGSLAKKNTKWRKSISAADRLALTLRFLATGESQRNASIDFCIGRATTCKIIAETCRLIWDLLAPKYLTCPDSPAEWKEAADEFDSQWNFPNCVGALGGKQIVTETPNNLSGASNPSGDQMMAVCDANYRFVCLTFGSPERESGEGVFALTELVRRLERRQFVLPDSVQLGTGPDAPYVFVADEPFPLKPFVVKPYYEDGRHQRTEKIFNYRVRRAYRVFENAFGILTSRWRILRRPFRASYSNTHRYIKACVCLHNFLMTEQTAVDVYCPSGYVDTDDWNGNVLLGEWRQEVDPVLGLQDAVRSCSDVYDPEAAQVRDTFAKFFVREGAVPWQESVVNRSTYMYFSS